MKRSPTSHFLSLQRRFFPTTLLLLLLLPQPSAAPMLAALMEEEDLCSDRSCYPATGNLLIGRKHRLSATSTCGLAGRQRYCIVSHLEDETKCFTCDSRQPWANKEPNRHSHRIENVVSENYEDRTRNWWQSENGVQNVSVRFDLEAEFHFTHLIMTFRSFRPAAMFIERSADFGKTWSIYRYFAYDCAASFPGIAEGLPKQHHDVICSRKYSDVAPSTGGELVYKVISPHIPTEDPYAPQIARLLKITNLRINFTKLHTLGDDLLDYRPEIDEKYFYALYELVVRGSCSCYGHAQRCIPMGEEEVRMAASQPDMVHGRCECTHNTQGLNCEQCMDFFNDVPWKPAIEVETNECRRCECNNHATRCHFDWAVYNASGQVSGGVCDDCAHNTQGKKCEQCKPYFYRDPQRTIDDPYVCRPCECDRAGSLYDGICEGEQDEKRGLIAGKCYCKKNVDGANCDRCRNGFWDMREDDADGCKACTCHLLGTVNNEGCNKLDGTCTCKRLVEGVNCDHCLPDHYGLSDEADGCKPCDCDPGGAVHNHCDIVSGQCQCRPHFSGRRCDVTDSSYYCPTIDYHTYEAERSHAYLSEMIPREPVAGREPTWTGEGFTLVRERSNLTFEVDDLRNSGLFNMVLRYELTAEESSGGWEDVKITVVRPGDPDPAGPCANINPSDDFLIARLTHRTRHVEVQPAVCLDAGVRYEIRVYFGEQRVGHASDPRSNVLIDSLVVVPQTEALDMFKPGGGVPNAEYLKQVYDRYQCRAETLNLTPERYLSEECKKFICPLAAAVMGEALECDCDNTGSTSGICQQRGGQCDCKPNVVGRRCDKCAVGTYGFGPNGCTACDCDSVGALSNACDKHSGQCECRERGITGRQCNQCQPGFWAFPDCRTCQCNGHASLCDQTTGACIDCRNLTDGMHCERCVVGYYGDPRLGVANLPCKPCPCPGGPGSGFQHADTCYLAQRQADGAQEIVCNCQAGYTGERCDRCEINHWGSPRDIGGSCEPCDCSNNIDRQVEGSCDAKTGDCIKCLYNTEGLQCENCQLGYFGDAKARNCHRCVCNQLGSVPPPNGTMANGATAVCDRVSGQCPCLPNVVGLRCDECAPLHYDMASREGCSACACDPTGVVTDPETGEPHLACNDIDGQCRCKPGRGGRQCADCQDYYWGDPARGECRRCECDPTGSTTLQCHRNNGTCSCRPGSGGPLCNECQRGYTGAWPQCQACGECFDNWDRILQELRHELESLVQRAADIEDMGISSEYDADFKHMEQQLSDVRSLLSAVNLTREDVDALRGQMDTLQTQLESAREQMAARNARITAVQSQLEVAGEAMRELNATGIRRLTQLTDELNANVTEMRKRDSQEAYKLVQESHARSKDYHRAIAQEVAKISQAETDRMASERLLDEHGQEFHRQYEANREQLEGIGDTVLSFASALPNLNREVCGAESDERCDAMCGGAAGECGRCGGTGCGGSAQRARDALHFAKEAKEVVEEKQAEAEEVLRSLRESAPNVASSKREAESALQLAKDHAARVNATHQELQKMLNRTRDLLEPSSERVTPEQIEQKIEQLLDISIPFTEQQLRELSQQIREKVADAKDSGKILQETSGNKTVALRLQKAAEAASRRAEQLRNTTKDIKDKLERAETIQREVEDALDKVQSDVETAKSSLTSTDSDIQQLETRVQEAAEQVRQMRNTTDNLKAEYVKITSNMKSASAAAQNASTMAKAVEEKHEELKGTYERVRSMVEERENGNEERKQRAEMLKKRSTELLAKIQRSKEQRAALIRRADALDVELAGFRTTIDSLSAQIEQVSTEIDRKVEFHTTCDA